MKKKMTVKKEFNNLESVLKHLQSSSPFESSKEYDVWDFRKDANGKIDECIVIKKSGMHGMKIHFSAENDLTLKHIVPNKILNVYFGDSRKAHRNIIEIVTGTLTKAILAGPKKKAFEEMEEAIRKIAA